MSEIKVNSIKGVGASTAAITVDNSSGSALANLTTVNSVTMPNGGFLSNRNLIINGAYTINQRGDTGHGSSGYRVVDRWTMSAGGLNNSMHQYQIDITAGDLPYTKGFRKMYRLTNDGQNADSNDYIQAVQHIEAQNIATSGWNYVSSSSNITLSFYVRASVSQTYHGYLQTHDGTSKTNSFSFALTANTWTRVTKTFPGDSTITINNDNGAGLTVHFTPFMGTDFTASSVTDGAWQTYASGARTTDQTSTWMTTAYSTFELTGVQLEVGSVATDFEHRSFGQEFALCQRYYHKLSSSDNKIIIFNDYNNSTNNFWANITLPVTMRAAPTLSFASLEGGAQTTLDSSTTSKYYLNLQVSNGATYIGNSTVIEAIAEL
jgi:hypothetical protein|tara:strand:+ start:197 stop:1327 length:1131 start_codon:yes stop_codon:yes gene_type:complete